jgi:hypothetical protein
LIKVYQQLNQKMSESNILRVLQTIIKDAVDTGDPELSAGLVLLGVMKLEPEPKNLVDFYELLSRAKDDAIKLKNISSDFHKEDYTEPVRAIEDLQDLFIATPPWTHQWKKFVVSLKNGRYTSVLSGAEKSSTLRHVVMKSFRML